VRTPSSAPGPLTRLPHFHPLLPGCKHGVFTHKAGYARNNEQQIGGRRH
jgi:hypothetical protein